MTKIIPINSTTDAFRNQTALFLQRMLDVNEWILSFPPIRGDKGIDDMWMIDASLPEYMRTCNPEWFNCYEYNCEIMLNTMHKDLFNEKSLGWFREHLETFAPYSEGARKLLKAIETWKTWGEMSDKKSEKQAESSVVVKPKGEFAEFARNIAGPMVIDGDGKPRDAYKPVLHAAYKGLQRFIEAQDKWNTYDKALEEVKNGKKETHWIWFIFPQLYGLGHSEMSQFYGLNGREEAEEYIKNDILRTRLVEICEAVLNNEKSVYEIFGNDAIKVRSCVLLFESVSDIPVFKQLKSKYRW